MRWPLSRLVAGLALAASVAACTSTSSVGSSAGSARSGASDSISATVGPSARTSVAVTLGAASSGASGSPSVVAAGMRLGPWGAATVGGREGHDTPLAGDHSSLFVGNGHTILRLDPASGDVLASVRVATPPPVQALIAAGVLWTVENGPTGTVRVRGLEPDTLTAVATIAMPMPGYTGSGEGVALDAATSDARVYVGVAHTIAVIDSRTRRIVHHYQLSGDGVIADLAVSPNDTRLYVTVNIPNKADSRLAVVNPSTGTALAPMVELNGGTGFAGVAASAGGVWLENGSGMTDRLNFRPFSDLARAVGPVTTAGGGFGTTSTVTSKVVWIGGTTTLACANPVTGAVRASARIAAPRHDAANISRLTVAGNRLFGYYVADAGPSELLIQLQPPARCAT